MAAQEFILGAPRTMSGCSLFAAHSVNDSFQRDASLPAVCSTALITGEPHDRPCFPISLPELIPRTRWPVVPGLRRILRCFDDGKKLLLLCSEVGRHKPVLKKPRRNREDDARFGVQRQPEGRPARVTFEADEDQS